MYELHAMTEHLYDGARVVSRLVITAPSQQVYASHAKTRSPKTALLAYDNGSLAAQEGTGAMSTLGLHCLCTNWHMRKATPLDVDFKCIPPDPCLRLTKVHFVFQALFAEVP